MQCFVTGVSGRIGSAVVTELLANGYDVVGTDQVEPAEGLGSPRDSYTFIKMPLDDAEKIAEAMAGSETLVHMAAIPHPTGYRPEFVFNNNMTSAFNVMQAAADAGIKRAVVASSLSALGTVWAPKTFVAQYVPIDEDHPLLPFDCYSLAKGLIEDIGKMFHRRTGMQIAAMRFPWVLRPSDYAAAIPGVAKDLAFGAPHCWSYLDVRDAAIACRQALEPADYGYGTFNIVASDSLSDIPTAELLATYAPSIEVRVPIKGTGSGYSTERARKAFGFEPKYSWRTE